MSLRTITYPAAEHQKSSSQTLLETQEESTDEDVAISEDDGIFC